MAAPRLHYFTNAYRDHDEAPAGMDLVTRPSLRSVLRDDPMLSSIGLTYPPVVDRTDFELQLLHFRLVRIVHCNGGALIVFHYNTPHLSMLVQPTHNIDRPFAVSHCSPWELESNWVPGMAALYNYLVRDHFFCILLG